MSTTMSIENPCPTVPTPYRGTAGQTPTLGTSSGASSGTKSLKALADRVLQRGKVGQGVGQGVGQEKKSCPIHPMAVGQENGLVPPAHEAPPRFSDATVFQGAPTPAAIDLADVMLKYIADQQRPCTEAEILEAVDADAVMARNILNRLAVDGIAEALPGGLFDIPPYPPRLANLPQGCPLRTGCPIPKGCRFEAWLFQRMIKEGTLPLPGGRCPLRSLCKLAGGG